MRRFKFLRVFATTLIVFLLLGVIVKGGCTLAADHVKDSKYDGIEINNLLMNFYGEDDNWDPIWEGRLEGISLKSELYYGPFVSVTIDGGIFADPYVESVRIDGEVLNEESKNAFLDNLVNLYVNKIGHHFNTQDSIDYEMYRPYYYQ